MDKKKSHFGFRLMALQFKIRDLLLPRREILKEVSIKPGSHVLDYGCGSGSYIAPLAKLVGASGKIYALDIHPLAVEAVHSVASRRKLKNVETILSSCSSGLPRDSLDAVLLYDTFHGLDDPEGVLKELHRVLKPDGILSFSDHHMQEIEIISRVTTGGLFKLSRKGKRTYVFLPEKCQ